MTISAFSDELAQVRTKKKEFLSQIEKSCHCEPNVTKLS